jgi:hypothetical protein
MSPQSRAFNNKYVVPLAMILMIGGFVALCQPWSEWLHKYSVAVTLVGLVIFSIFARFGPAPDKD